MLQLKKDWAPLLYRLANILFWTFKSTFDLQLYILVLIQMLCSQIRAIKISFYLVLIFCCSKKAKSNYKNNLYVFWQKKGIYVTSKIKETFFWKVLFLLFCLTSEPFERLWKYFETFNSQLGTLLTEWFE